jgi:hypothetical protein
MNPEDSKQFDDIMGRNFPKQTETKMANRALEGAAHDLIGSPEQNLTGLSRMRNFPSHMISADENGDFQVKYRSPKGWTHTWKGGPYIEHGNDRAGAVDVTNLQHYALGWGENSYEKGEFTPEEFMRHVNEFEEYAPENYPKDYLP